MLAMSLNWKKQKIIVYKIINILYNFIVKIKRSKKMKLFIGLLVLVAIGQSVLFHFQMKSVSKVSPEQMYEITMDRNGVEQWQR